MRNKGIIFGGLIVGVLLVIGVILQFTDKQAEPKMARDRVSPQSSARPDGGGSYLRPKVQKSGNFTFARTDTGGKYEIDLTYSPDKQPRSIVIYFRPELKAVSIRKTASGECELQKSAQLNHYQLMTDRDDIRFCEKLFKFSEESVQALEHDLGWYLNNKANTHEVLFHGASMMAIVEGKRQTSKGWMPHWVIDIPVSRTLDEDVAV